jgi:hypothetical protein
MLSQLQGLNAAGRTRKIEGKKKKKSSDLIGNRTRDLQTCSIVPESTKLPRVYCETELYVMQQCVQNGLGIRAPMTVFVTVFFPLGPRCHAVSCC